MHKYKILKKDLLYKGRVFDLTKEVILIQNKTLASDIINHPGAVVMIPLLKNNKVIFVRQFRPALKKFILELPAGTLKKNENPLSAAKRELLEETGFSGKKFHKILEVAAVPGYSTEIMHFYIAKSLSKNSHPKLDKDEILNVKILTLKKAIKLIEKNEIIDSKTIIGLLILKNFKP